MQLIELKEKAAPRFENKVKKIYEQDYSLKTDQEPAPFMSLFRFADRKDIVLMVLGSICAVANGIAIPFFAFPYGQLTEAFSQNASRDVIVEQVKKAYVAFLINAVFVFLFSWIMFSSWMITSERQSIKCRKMYFEALMNQEVAWYDHTRIQELASNVYSESSQLQNAIGEKVSKIFMTSSMGIAGFVIAFARGWKLAIVVTSVIPFLLIAGFFNNHFLKKASDFMAKITTKAQGMAEEVLYSIKTVKVLNGQSFESDNYRTQIARATQKAIDYGYVRGSMASLFFFSIIMTYTIGFWYGTVLVSNREVNTNSGVVYTVGDVVVIFFTVYMSGLNLGQIPECVKNFMAGRKAAARIFSVLDRVPLIKSGEVKITQKIEGISFKKMEYYYENPLFENFNIDIKKGKTAFVGESGSGKSTIVGLILRFYDPVSGNINIKIGDKNIDLTTLNLNEYRDKIGYVGQQPVLIGTTIRQAISYTPREEQQIITALKVAEAWDFVKTIGLDSQFGALSGGQKQRIAIARAIIKKPEILILDEATSALDRRNEKQIQATLDKLQVPFMIVIAHKIQTIKSSSDIIVLEHGKIIERGDYAQLMKKKGKFYELAKAQEQVDEDQNQRNFYGTGGQSFKSMENSGVFVRKDSQLSNKQNKIDQVKAKDGAQAPVEDTQQQIEAKQAQQFKWGLFWRLLNYNKRYLWLMIIGLIAAGFTGTVFPLFSSFLSEIVVVLSSLKSGLDADLPRFQQKASQLTKVLFVISGLGLIFQFIKTCSFLYMAEKLSFSLKKDVYRKLLFLPYPYHEKKEGKQTARILSGDCHAVNGLTSQLLSDILENTTTLIVGLVIAFVNCWQITLVSLALIPILLLAGKAQMNFNVGFSTQTDQAYKRSHEVVLNSILNYRTLLAFNLTQQMRQRYDELLQEPLKIAIKKGNIAGLLFGLAQMILSCILSLIFFIGSLFIRDLGMDVLKVFTAIYAIMFAAIQAGGNLQFIPNIVQLKIAAVNIFKVLDEEDEQQYEKEHSARLQIQNAKGNIELKDIGFKYENRQDFVFKKLSLKIQEGQKVAFVGSSGCGKSTILQLLLRMYPLTEGQIVLDGHKIQDYQINQLRSQFGVVSQEPVLFNRSVLKNIKYNKPEIPDLQVLKAAQKANALEFITKGNFGFDPVADKANQPEEQRSDYCLNEPVGSGDTLSNGFKRKVGVRGSFLSGGQRQRVAIARAIVRKPRILLLDQATSALDTTNQEQVQKALDSIEGLTTIIVAHRLSTIQRCDKIFVFDKGSIVEQGSYHDLLQLRGHFFKLANGLSQKPKKKAAKT